MYSENNFHALFFRLRNVGLRKVSLQLLGLLYVVQGNGHSCFPLPQMPPRGFASFVERIAAAEADRVPFVVNDGSVMGAGVGVCRHEGQPCSLEAVFLLSCHGVQHVGYVDARLSSS